MNATSAISVPQTIVDALSAASQRTGAGFDYLLKTAMRESGLKTDANAPTSSATGLFQFIEQTWLATVKETGAKHGLAAFADDISETSGGRYIVADPQARQEILALRSDPLIASVMAGELTEMNRAELSSRLGREPSEGELYIGHFLGSSNAAALISAAANSPDSSAAVLFPSAARSNASIFYDRSGAARGAREVYAELVRRHEGASAPRAVASDPRDFVAPFAGIVAFFDKLFSGTHSAKEPAEIAVSYRAAPRPDSAEGPDAAEGDEVGAAGNIFTTGLARTAGGEQGADRLAALTAAANAYRTNVEISLPAEGDAWGGGLFTNAPRMRGPITALDLRGPV